MLCCGEPSIIQLGLGSLLNALPVIVMTDVYLAILAWTIQKMVPHGQCANLELVTASFWWLKQILRLIIGDKIPIKC